MDNYRVVWIKETYKPNNDSIYDLYAKARQCGKTHIPVSRLVSVMEEEVDIELTGRWRVKYDKQGRSSVSFEIKGGVWQKNFWLYDYQIEVIRSTCVNTCGPTEEQLNEHPW